MAASIFSIFAQLSKTKEPEMKEYGEYIKHYFSVINDIQAIFAGVHDKYHINSYNATFLEKWLKDQVGNKKQNPLAKFLIALDQKVKEIPADKLAPIKEYQTDPIRSKLSEALNVIAHILSSFSDKDFKLNSIETSLKNEHSSPEHWQKLNTFLQRILIMYYPHHLENSPNNTYETTNVVERPTTLN